MIAYLRKLVVRVILGCSLFNSNASWLCFSYGRLGKKQAKGKSESLEMGVKVASKLQLLKVRSPETSGHADEVCQMSSFPDKQGSNSLPCGIASAVTTHTSQALSPACWQLCFGLAAGQGPDH